MSSSRSVGTVSMLLPVALPAILGSVAYGAYKVNFLELVKQFCTGPGRTSRLIALFVILFNWKSLPLAWTVRIFHTMISHIIVRKPHSHPPSALFHPAVTTTHVSILEVDYNLHKSNSTYFADLDVSRSHLVSHIAAKGIRELHRNAETKLVMDPRDPSKAAKGKFGVMLGAVHCSFKKEIPPFTGYEMWTRVLSWDRKWMYMVTHFVEKGAVKPRSWDGLGNYGPTRKTEGKPEDWEKKIYATAVSKYVFKVGRLTVHPAVVLGASGLLPERPGGWVLDEPSGTATPSEEAKTNGHANGNGHAVEQSAKDTWDWTRTEAERKRGMEFAAHFAALDGLSNFFDGGEEGALGRFTLG